MHSAARMYYRLIVCLLTQKKMHFLGEETYVHYKLTLIINIWRFMALFCYLLKVSAALWHVKRDGVLFFGSSSKVKKEA